MFANHFFFLLAEGSAPTPYGTSPVCAGTFAFGIGRDKAAAIWYRALDVYFTSGETYADAAHHTMTAARDLFGRCSIEWRAVAQAWGSVGVSVADAELCISKNLFLMCDCIRICPDLDSVRWPAEIPEWGTGPIVQVAVHMSHSRRGDLRIDLVAPTGQAYRVKDANPEDTAADVIDVFDVYIGQSMRPGTWTLVVTDTVRGEKGYLSGWGLAY